MAARVGVYQLAVSGTYHNRPWASVCYFRQADGDSVALTVAENHACNVALANAYKASFSTGQVNTVLYIKSVLRFFQYSDVTVTPPRPFGPLWLEEDFNDMTATTGAVNGDGLPPTSAVKGSKQTVHPGRTGRGSLHIIGLPEDDQKDGKLTAPAQVLWQVAFTGFLATFIPFTVGATTYNMYAAIYSNVDALDSGVAPAPAVSNTYAVWSSYCNFGVGRMSRRSYRNLANPF